MLGFVWLRGSRCIRPTRGSVAAGPVHCSPKTTANPAPPVRSNGIGAWHDRRWNRSSRVSRLPRRAPKSPTDTGEPEDPPCRSATPEGAGSQHEPRFAPKSGPRLSTCPERMCRWLEPFSAHPERFASNLTPRGARRPAPEGAVHGFGPISAKAEGTGLRPDRHRLHTERSRPEAGASDRPGHPKATEPALTRRERGRIRAAASDGKTRAGASPPRLHARCPWPAGPKPFPGHPGQARVAFVPSAAEATLGTPTNGWSGDGVETCRWSRQRTCPEGLFSR